MAPAILTTVNSISLTPGSIFISRKNNPLTRCKVFQKSCRQTLSAQRYAKPLSTSVRLFPHFRVGFDIPPKLRTPTVSSAETDVAVEEADSPIEAPETSADVGKQSEESSVKSDDSPTPVRSKRLRPDRKSEMPPVKNEDLIPGATFTGKVKSIQPFGAFVDFGAFTDGLVHISNVSSSFVKDISTFVSVGQEVTVRLLDANMETRRISLTMRESDETSKQKQPKDAPANNDKSRTPKQNPQRSNQRREVREGVNKTSKFVKGQDLEGTVKNLTRSGAFISLPEEEEGFLPKSEMEFEAFGSIIGESPLQVGQEVKVRVLRITNRGQVTLTMKKEEAAGELDSKLQQSVIHRATNPFVLAFRKNEEISAFLDQREEEELAEKSEKDDSEADGDVSIASSETVEKDKEVVETIDEDKDSKGSPPVSFEDVNDASQNIDEESEKSFETLEAKDSTTTTDQLSEEPSAVEDEDKDVKNNLPGSLEEVNSASQNIVEESAASSETLEAEASTTTTDQTSEETSATEDDSLPETADQLGAESEVSTTTMDQLSEEPSVVNDAETSDAEPELSQQIADKSLSSESSVEEASEGPVHNVKDEAQTQTNDSVELPSTQSVEVPVGADFSENGSTAGLSEQNVVSQNNNNLTEENERSGEAVIGNTVAEDEMQKETPKAAISPAVVKQLREETGAGMMDCKKALSATDGDIVKALEYLRKKGLASADKKASRATAEGRIGSYIHDSRIGVLIEVNCETDFVSRGDIFKELIDDLAMQVAACPQVQYLATEDVPEEIVNKEREIEMQKEDLLSKPEQIRSKIVDGRISKRLGELALLEQPFIKNDKVVVKDWIKQTIATIGENIKVKRFVRYNLGEGLEKKSQDFAAEVAAQTAAKSAPPPAKEQPAVTESEETVEAPKKAAVSAALVKQLREETGAGMMDCKKALSETGGDLEKAQEYLRKKGLSSADKKSSRIAAEGRIGSYIHDSRIGVLIEVNCETDFVGRSEKFKELVDDLAMQVVACPQVQCVSIEDIPEDIVNKEKELEMQREDLQNKPENIREKIVEGRVLKRLGELALMERPFVKDDSVLVKDLVKQTVATLGENIKIRRFIRFTLGE